MADSGSGAVNASHEYEVPLLINSSITTNGGERNSSSTSPVEGVVDYKGERVLDRSKFGGWRSALLIIAFEIGDTVAYYGVFSNLINYLTSPLGQSTVVAAENINVWVGVLWMLPLLGAFIADTYVGRFRTIVFSSIIYVLGLGLLTLSAVLTSLKREPQCNYNTDKGTSCGSPSSFQVIFFFSSLYLVAVGRAGFKPCAQAFGADQFDAGNPEECKSKSSFFNWWIFGLCFGSIISRLILTYIQDNLSWGLGFGIPFITLVVGVTIFLLGTKTYRYSMKEDNENPLLGIGRVFISAAKRWRTTSSIIAVKEEETRMSAHCTHDGTHQFKFLDKALFDISNDQLSSSKHGMPCTLNEVEDAKAVLRLVPIWATCLMYAVVVSQYSTFFTKQASTMDRSIGPQFKIPAASLQTFISLSTIIFVTIYDRLFVPLTRSFTGKPNGITMLQRIGIGLFLSTTAMVVAALIEKRRIQIAFDYGLIDLPNETLPMSIWWLVPQYILLGLADVFTLIGLQEFFYDQVPNGLRSIGVALYLSILGIGRFLSGFLISIIETITGGSDRYSWFSNNLNRAHLDYFYWLLAGFSMIELVAYLYFSKSYLYKRKFNVM